MKSVAVLLGTCLLAALTGCDAGSTSGSTSNSTSNSTAGQTAAGARSGGAADALRPQVEGVRAPTIKGSLIACGALAPPAPDDHGDGATVATPLALGQTATGVLEAASDADWFAVPLEPGRRYRVAVEAAIPPGIGLVEADGRGDVAAAPPGAAELIVEAPAAGVHFVRLNTLPGAPAGARYAVSVVPAD